MAAVILSLPVKTSGEQGHHAQQATVRAYRDGYLIGEVIRQVGGREIPKSIYTVIDRINSDSSLDEVDRHAIFDAAFEGCFDGWLDRGALTDQQILIMFD